MEEKQLYTVEVYNMSGDGVVLEGKARLVDPVTDVPSIEGHQRWVVQFPEDEETYERNIRIADLPKELVAATTETAPKAPEDGVSGNVIKLLDLAKEFKMNSKSLRKRLREEGFKKGGSRWAWFEEDSQLEEIRKVLSTPETKEETKEEPEAVELGPEEVKTIEPEVSSPKAELLNSEEEHQAAN